MPREVKEGWNADAGTRCPYSMSDLGKRCAWLAGHYDRYGLAAWEMAR